MIYVISKATFGSYNVRDIQCNANWDCCPYSDYALIPDNLVDSILATKGYCDITLNSAGDEVTAFTARSIPSVPEECCGERTATEAYVNDRMMVATDPNNDGRIVLEYGGEVVPGGGGSVDQEEINKLMQEIEKIKAELNYKEITIIKFNNPAAGTHEIGSTINGVSLSWELSKNPESQTLNGSALGTDVRSKAYDGPITTNQTYSLSVTDEKGTTASASSSITFLNGVYYDVLESDAAIDSAVVLSLTRKLQGSKGITFTVDAGATQKIVFALPTRYGTPNFNVGGFDGGFAKANTFDFTNASGYTESYDVWMSENAGLGSTTVKVS